MLAAFKGYFQTYFSCCSVPPFFQTSNLSSISAHFLSLKDRNMFYSNVFKKQGGKEMASFVHKPDHQLVLQEQWTDRACADPVQVFVFPLIKET